MKISIISASHRTNSQSKRISDLLHKNLLINKPGLEIFSLDLAEASLPLWSPDKKNGKGIFLEKRRARLQFFGKGYPFRRGVPSTRLTHQLTFVSRRPAN